MLIPNKHSGYLAGRRIYQGGKGGGAPAPDPQLGAASLRQIQLAERQYADYLAPGGDREWIRGITDEAIGLSRTSAQKANALTDYQLAQMRLNDQRYQTVGIPYEDQLITNVNRLSSPAYTGQMVNLARAEAQTQSESAQDQQMRELNRMGIIPSSGRAMVLRNQADTARVSAVAAAANKTRLAADQIGLSNQLQLYGGMRGLAGLGNASASLAGAAMGTGVNSAGTMGNLATSNTAANTNAFNSAMGGMSAGMSGLANYNNLQQQAASINNANDPLASLLGAGSYLGAAAIGRGVLWGSDRRLKSHIKRVGVDAKTGLNLYEFTYKWLPDQRFVGVMADEVELVYPHAVHVLDDGFKAVDYGALGLEMRPLGGAA